MADNYWKKRAVKDTAEKLDLTPIAIPVGCQKPETTNEAIARILYSSGQMSLDAYNAVRGIEYDMDYEAEEDFDFEDGDDDLEMSTFAKYEDELSTDFADSAKQNHQQNKRASLVEEAQASEAKNESEANSELSPKQQKESALADTSNK